MKTLKNLTRPVGWGLSTAIVTGALGLVVVLFVQWIAYPAQPDKLPQSERVNLALRRTAHHLFLAAGDSTSRIPAVQQSDPLTYRIRLDHAFDYDRLPRLLEKSFQVQRIVGNYNVAVLDCAKGQLQLGYNMIDLASKEPVTCGGRTMTAGCYVLQVRFNEPAPANTKRAMYWQFLALGGVFVGFLFMVWKRQKLPELEPVPSTDPVLDPSSQLSFGQSSLAIRNQILTVDGQTHNLTYRETKLLRVLATHANQVLERDQILKLVWEDEGIIVGRSVDVFVSRLRKLLHHDPLVKIVAIHGVGYRMEVQSV